MYLMHLWTKANVFHSNSSNSMLLWYSHLFFHWNGFRFAFRFPFIDSRFVGIILELKMQSMGVDLYFNKECLPLFSQPFDLPPFKMCRLQTKFYVRTFLQWICWYQLTTAIMDGCESILVGFFFILWIVFAFSWKTMKRIEKRFFFSFLLKLQTVGINKWKTINWQPFWGSAQKHLFTNYINTIMQLATRATSYCLNGHWAHEIIPVFNWTIMTTYRLGKKHFFSLCVFRSLL